MDRIGLLSDYLILKILSFVPSKVAVTTSFLSKRWGSLWKRVPILMYRDPSSESEHWRASRFIDKFLLLHEAPVLETLDLSLSQYCPSTDIYTWIRIAISRGLRNLRFYANGPYFSQRQLPWSMFTCQTLVNLTLRHAIIVDVPLTMCFPSLRVLSLALMTADETICRLLSGCPVLEDLRLVRYGYASVNNFIIAVPSLQRLIVLGLQCGSQATGTDVGFLLKTPSLKSLTIVNHLHFHWVGSLVQMPKLVKANIILRDSDSKKLLGCLTTTKHLSLCAKPPMDPYPIFVFSQLMSLELCTCSSDWLRLILGHTPLLRVLKCRHPIEFHTDIYNLQRCCTRNGDVRSQWEQPSSVPECLISRLETVEWNGYKGTEAEKKVAMYLLENSGQLKTMAIRTLPLTSLEAKHMMLLELASAPRSSGKCRLSFT